MKVFNSPLLFAEHLIKMAVKESVALHEGLEKSVKLIEKSAKDEIGHLQPAVGNYNAWAELTDVTKADKEAKGYVFNEDYNPLYRTGGLQDSISHEVGELEAVTGSTSELMPFFEYGTSKMPPRPVIGPAAFKNREKIKSIIGLAAFGGIAGIKTDV